MSKDEIVATDDAIALAEENAIDIDDVIGTGKNGKVKKGDVQKYLDSIAGYPEDADEPEEEQEPEAVEEPKKTVKKGKCICVLAVKENGGSFKSGDEYTGKRKDYLLSRNAIKRVE